LYKAYRHSPPHYFSGRHVYMVTASTYRKGRYLRDDSVKEYLLELILNSFSASDWTMIAY
jgi:hypothetical protein